MSERDERGFWTGKGGHLWRESRGPGSRCVRCHLAYARWSGDRCPSAPDCTAIMPGTEIQCAEEDGHEGDHEATVQWAATPP